MIWVTALGRSGKRDMEQVDRCGSRRAQALVIQKTGVCERKGKHLNSL